MKSNKQITNSYFSVTTLNFKTVLVSIPIPLWQWVISSVKQASTIAVGRLKPQFIQATLYYTWRTSSSAI